MRYVLAVFMSRRDAMAFGSRMIRLGVRVTAVNTPSSISKGCSLSVKFPASAIEIARRVLSTGEFQSFRGFYES